MTTMNITIKHSTLIKEAAVKTLEWHKRTWPNDKMMLKCGKGDHDDLMKIAKMIENNEDNKKIARFMSGLDTIVRELIPDQVYYAYTE